MRSDIDECVSGVNVKASPGSSTRQKPGGKVRVCTYVLIAQMAALVTEANGTLVIMKDILRNRCEPESMEAAKSDVYFSSVSFSMVVLMIFFSSCSL